MKKFDLWNKDEQNNNIESLTSNSNHAVLSIKMIKEMKLSEYQFDILRVAS